MDRRTFLSTATAALATTAGAAQEYDQSKKRRVGVIGPGWYGKSDVLRLVQVSPVEIVSICDVNRQTMEKAAALIASRQQSKKQPRMYGDYREMLKEKDLDICLIDTPDHWHALPAIEAIKAGCDLYLQKPISVDIMEGQAILAAARKYKRVVQVGTQRRSTPHLIEAKEKFIKSGALGRIGLVEICCYYPQRASQSPADAPAPEHLNWEMWTGPAPMFPHNPMRSSRWRAFMEYGNGTVGDMGIHMYDMARWMMDLGWPESVSSSGGVYMESPSISNILDTQTAIFKHGKVDVVWTHRNWGQAPDPKYPWAGIFYGEKGVLKASVMGYDYLPAQGQGTAEHKDVTFELEQYPEDKTEERLEKHVAPAIRGHMKNLLACCDTRSKPVADIEQGHISTAACILANMSAKLGRSLKWDAVKGEIAGDAEANRLLARPYRKPWQHPDPKAV